MSEVETNETDAQATESEATQSKKTTKKIVTPEELYTELARDRVKAKLKAAALDDDK